MDYSWSTCDSDTAEDDTDDKSDSTSDSSDWGKRWGAGICCLPGWKSLVGPAICCSSLLVIAASSRLEQQRQVMKRGSLRLSRLQLQSRPDVRKSSGPTFCLSYIRSLLTPVIRMYENIEDRISYIRSRVLYLIKVVVFISSCYYLFIFIFLFFYFFIFLRLNVSRLRNVPKKKKKHASMQERKIKFSLFRASSGGKRNDNVKRK
jgi:hypothetical protein